MGVGHSFSSQPVTVGQLRKQDAFSDLDMRSLYIFRYLDVPIRSEGSDLDIN